MRILIAPDKFKGSLGAREVAENIAAGLRDVLPNAAIEIVLVADGGEGTAEAIGRACGGKWITCSAHDALGHPITARYVWLSQSATAVLEMSEAAGAWRIAARERHPIRADTFGVGEMLRDAIRRGAKEIVVGLGGSATNDGGFGMARALGFRFLNRTGADLIGSVSDLLNLAKILSLDVEALVPNAFGLAGRLTQAPLHLIAAADVRNPLLGARGATRTFGPQKGATPDQLEVLEGALARLADVVARDLDCDFREAAGAGAAGGLGFGLMSFCGATIRPGFDLVAEMLDLEAAIQRADVVITGEGDFDEQTLAGKAPAGVARLARARRKRIYAIVGCVAEHMVRSEVFDGVFTLVRPPLTREESITRAAALVRERARELGAAL